MKNIIKKLLRENLDKTVNCKNCGWHWKMSEGSPDMYFCHKCGQDNTPDNIMEEEDTDIKLAAGVLIKCVSTERVLLLLRNDKRPKWSLVAGGIEEGEDILNGLKREIREELSIDPEIIRFKHRGVEENSSGLVFHYYEGLTYEEFTPTLNNENLKWGWFSKMNTPYPLFKGMRQKIENI